MRLTHLAAVAMIAIIVATALSCNPGPAQPETEIHPDLIGRNGVPLLTEFGDFNCQFCIKFAAEILPQLRRDLIEPGIIEYRYRHYPFLAETSLQAAAGAECARNEGKFEQWHDSIFHSALNRTLAGTTLTNDDLNAGAFEAQVDPQTFSECLHSGTGTRQVEHDRRLANSAGVRGTPTLFLDGIQISWEDYNHLHSKLAEATDH